MALSRLCALIEGLLLVAPQGLDQETLVRAAEPTGGQETLSAALDELALHYQTEGHGLRLQRGAGLVRLVTAGDHASVIGRFLGAADAQKLSTAALETLAVVAYCQPVTRGRLEGIRGVNCDHILAALEERGLVTELGRADTVGRPLLYGTTPAFLERFGLAGLEDLPSMPPELRALIGGQATPGDQQGSGG